MTDRTEEIRARLEGYLAGGGLFNPELANHDAAFAAVQMILNKQSKNERRDWPDWRTMSQDAAIEHVRGNHD